MGKTTRPTQYRKTTLHEGSLIEDANNGYTILHTKLDITGSSPNPCINGFVAGYRLGLGLSLGLDCFDFSFAGCFCLFAATRSSMPSPFLSINSSNVFLAGADTAAPRFVCGADGRSIESPSIF